jgi:DNA-binding CsgD family transcriptional regulator
MAAAHCFIRLFSGNEFDRQEIELFASEQWTIEEEEQLIDRIHELFTHIRPLTKSILFNLEVQVADTIETRFILNKKISRKYIPVKIQKLTVRELQVTDLIAQGFTNKEIAQQLSISLETVRSHRKHVLLKTGSRNTAMLIKHYDQLLVNN